MIYARLLGGLGNQLFQYATARAVALRNGAELVLDARLCRDDDHTRYGLGAFAIRARRALPAELPPGRDRPLAHALWRRFGRHPRFVRERGLGFNPSVLSLGDDVYLHGYFQSERYFADQADILRDELTIIDPPTAPVAAMAARIAGVPAVSVHLRRGDYVTDSRAARAHGGVGADYYDRALRLVAERAGIEPVVFVFSNDPGWARENLRLAFETRIVAVADATRPHDDLRLMAACRHHVIVNSTFSWWGAWLDPNPEKIVVAPRRWFADPGLSNPDILPAGWISV